MRRPGLRNRLLLLTLGPLVLAGAGGCHENPFFRFLEPGPRQLSAGDGIALSLLVPESALPGTLALSLDEAALDPADFVLSAGVLGDVLAGPLPPLADGDHELAARVELELPGFLGWLWAWLGLPPPVLTAERSFEVVTLTSEEGCEVLNQVECLLPYPSSYFLVEADTPTGHRLDIPQAGMPTLFGNPTSPDALNQLDGFGPGVHPLLFLRDADLEASGAPGLDPVTRTFDGRSLDSDSPTVLLDAETGERVLHFVELDARIGVSVDPTRQVMFLRPGRTLEPGRRYIVAVRGIVDSTGAPIPPEPAFAVLRDRRPTTIPEVAERRDHHEWIFHRLRRAGIPRHDLQLAFDFVVQSQEAQTGRLLAMRDRAYAWLDEALASGETLFEVDSFEELDCDEQGLWRDVQGRFQVPLFLTNDPLVEPTVPGFVLEDADGLPTFDEIVHARFTMLVPCSARDGEPTLPLVHAHPGGGDFRTASRYHHLWNGDHPTNPTPGVPNRDSPLVAPHYLIGGTDNHGFGNLEFGNFDGQPSFLFNLFFIPNASPSLSARIHQGQVNVLVLTRLMKRAVFNTHPVFQTPSGEGVFLEGEPELYVWGVSFGGFTALITGAISPDVDKIVPSVAVLNFANQAQRDEVFDAIDPILPFSLGPDSMTHAISQAISHDLWAEADPVAYLRHLRGDPLPGTDGVEVLLSVGSLDQKAPNLFSDVAARDLGLSSLEGSFRTNLLGIPDVPGPLASAYVAFSPSLDADDPDHAPYLPPLENRTAELATPTCDPHILTFLTPAYLDQVGAFLQPGGTVTNTCTGTCDGLEPEEREYGNPDRCDPTVD